MPTTYTTNTITSRDKFAAAEMSDMTTLPYINEVAFGNDGVDENNDPVEPDPTAITVPGEFIKKSYENVTKVEDMVYRITFELDYGEGIGEDVSSCGIYDSDGDLMAIKNFEPIPKTDENRITIEWDRQF